MSSRPFPLPSDVEGTRKRAADYLYRAAASYIRSHVTRGKPEDAARELFGRDSVTELVLRAASSGATTTGSGWADSLARASIDDTIAAIASLSAGADVISRGTRVNFDGFGSIKIPGRAFAANNADGGQWVAEDAPIPNRALSFTSGVTLTPRKVAVLLTFTREMSESSAIEQISKAMVSEALGLALDAAMFGTAAGDTTKPAGLLNGVTPITATTGGGIAAMTADLAALVSALAAAHGGKNVVFVVAPKQATTMKATLGPLWDYPIISSASLAAGTVIALELASFVSAFAPTPEFLLVRAATIHREDTSPQNITGGTPSPAVPVTSYFQSDLVGLRMVLRASWAMRATGHVQVITGATW